LSPPLAHISRDDWLRDMFCRTAPRYIDDIEPALGPLAAGLIAFAGLRPGERILDLGAGTGLVARGAARAGCWAVGFDLAWEMMATTAPTSVTRLPGLHFAAGNMHALPFATDAFDAALSSFGFNSTDPTFSLRETWRVLRPGGRLIFQEWDEMDDLTEVVNDTLAGYLIENPQPDLARQREFLAEPDAWDDLEDEEGIAEALHEAGFVDVRVETVAPQVRFGSAATFIRYALAWASRYDEVEAMNPEARALLYGELAERLGAKVGPAEGLIWRPNLIRARARRPPA
jgi:ubiquinone/menaquinone biosynthesis C-methylase UbiE